VRIAPRSVLPKPSGSAPAAGGASAPSGNVSGHSTSVFTITLEWNGGEARVARPASLPFSITPASTQTTRNFFSAMHLPFPLIKGASDYLISFSGLLHQGQAPPRATKKWKGYAGPLTTVPGFKQDETVWSWKLVMEDVECPQSVIVRGVLDAGW
jgi:hypothetical protein